MKNIIHFGLIFATLITFEAFSFNLSDYEKTNDHPQEIVSPLIRSVLNRTIDYCESEKSKSISSNITYKVKASAVKNAENNLMEITKK